MACGGKTTHYSPNALNPWPKNVSSFCAVLCVPLTDFIYSEYLTTLRKFEFRQLVWQIAQDYSAAALLLRLPGYVPMPAFTAIEDVPLVVRHARKTPQQASTRRTHASITLH